MDYSYHTLEYLYIHWPFCPYKCNFCDFVALASHEQFMQQYHDALLVEMNEFHKHNPQKRLLKTIYLGGGTPSTYPQDLLLDMFGTLEHMFLFDENTEVTIEVNPGTIKPGLLKAWKQAGINRLSIGVQSLKDVVLQGLNRHQKKTDVLELLNEATEYFENLSVDFILGLPGVSVDEWKAMIREAMTWPIKHISVYFLMVHEKTPLYYKVKKQAIVLPPDDEIIDLYHWTVDLLQEYGFMRYELSNFAQKGFESRHNQAYWQRKNYKGFGLGACSFNGAIRFQNHKNLGKYLESGGTIDKVVYESEELSSDQVKFEKIMLGLRQAEGVELVEILDGFNEVKKATFFEVMHMLEQQGFLYVENGRLYLTPKGLVVENEVAIKLFPE